MALVSNATPQKTSSIAWYNRVGGAFALCGLGLVAAYLLGSRAIFTGSLQQYALAIALFGYSINRAMCGFRAARGRQ